MNASDIRRFRLPAFLLGGLFAIILQRASGAEPDYTAYGQLLDRYVVDGGVRYDTWAVSPDDVEALDEVLAAFARVDPDKLSRDEQMAFYLNLYNASMLQVVLEEYPIESVREIGLLPFAVFRREFIRLDGRELSLDEVEKGILLKEFDDPRIHFAVNCASVSCPPLRAEPYVAGRLDAQLDEQTRNFAASAEAARVDHQSGRTAYSQLFDWYRDDFGTDNPADYLNRFRDSPLPRDHRVTWIDYNWALNRPPEARADSSAPR